MPPPSASPGIPTAGGEGGASWATIPIGGTSAAISPATISGLLGSLGLFEWVVPGAVIAIPGFLLILTVLAQMAGASAWLPLVRRRIGEFGLLRPNRRRRATVS